MPQRLAMHTPFPTELDPACVQGVLGPLFGRGDFRSAEFACCAYNLLGYALYNIYGETPQTLAQGENPAHLANVLSQAPPEVQKFMDFTNSQGDQLVGANAESLPPWALPFIQQLAAWAIQKLAERFAKQENPKLFGMQLKGKVASLPPQTGGAFPERNQGQPTGTGLHTQSHPQPSPAQQGGPQSQPSDRMQQPTGNAPEQHPSVPTSSRSPQFQANTADPRVQHEPRQPSGEARGPALTNAPGVQGNPVVPRESGGMGGQPAQGPQTNLPPANPPQQPPSGGSPAAGS